MSFFLDGCAPSEHEALELLKLAADLETRGDVSPRQPEDEAALDSTRYAALFTALSGRRMVKA